MTLYEYFDRIAIIHLLERRDRFESLSAGLRGMGFDIQQPKVQIPHAPRPSDANGFPSRGVYGNFLSHLGILRQAWRDGPQAI
jgi:glycosyl transferase, family 25